MTNFKMRSMKYLLYMAFFVGLLACDDSEELPPRIEDTTGWSITIPTTRLSYEERDSIKKMKDEYTAAVAKRAEEEIAVNK